MTSLMIGVDTLDDATAYDIDTNEIFQLELLNFHNYWTFVAIFYYLRIKVLFDYESVNYRHWLHSRAHRFSVILHISLTSIGDADRNRGLSYARWLIAPTTSMARVEQSPRDTRALSQKLRAESLATSSSRIQWSRACWSDWSDQRISRTEESSAVNRSREELARARKRHVACYMQHVVELLLPRADSPADRPRRSVRYAQGAVMIQDFRGDAEECSWHSRLRAGPFFDPFSASRGSNLALRGTRNVAKRIPVYLF